MIDDVLVRKINDPYKHEEEIKPVELRLYSNLIRSKESFNDDNEVAKEIFNQLIDRKNDKEKYKEVR